MTPEQKEGAAPSGESPHSRRNETLRNKRFLSAGMLFMGLIITLGAIAVVNGLWSKNLVIIGTVQTGDLNADWDCGYTNDDGGGLVQGDAGPCAITAEPPGDTGADPCNPFNPAGCTAPPKDVAECDLVIGDTGIPDPAIDYGDQVAYITIHNAYPSYECTVVLFLTNTGSIPFNIIGYELAGLAPPLELLPIGVDDLGCSLGTGVSSQLDPGGERELRCRIHVMQSARQSDCTGTTTVVGGIITVDENCPPGTTADPNPVTYSFGIKVCVAQWNEVLTGTSAEQLQRCRGISDATHDNSDVQHEGPP
jgi:hypothetical protein